MNQPHGFQPVHARHEDIEEQEVELPGLEQRQPLAAIAGNVNAVTCPFQQNPDGRLHGDIIIDDQDLCQSISPFGTWNQTQWQVARVSLNLHSRASTSRQKRPVNLGKSMSGKIPYLHGCVQTRSGRRSPD
jgi:hypothetical protein